MSYKTFTSLTGGADGSLDGIASATFATGHLATGQVGEIVYNYFWDPDNSSSESSPTIIAPDDIGGNGRWVLADVRQASLTISDDLSIGGSCVIDEVSSQMRLTDTNGSRFLSDLSGGGGSVISGGDFSDDTLWTIGVL